MALAAATFRRKLREVMGRVDACIDRKTIGEAFERRFGDKLIEAVIQAAKDGIGPGRKPYPGYEPGYAKQVSKSGGQKPWLVGIDSGTGKMLAKARFKYEYDADGTLWLVWRPDPSVPGMAVYGRVHNEGLPLGRGGPKKLRPWMHFDNPGVQAKRQGWMRQTIAELTSMAARGQTPR